MYDEPFRQGKPFSPCDGAKVARGLEASLNVTACSCVNDNAKLPYAKLPPRLRFRGSFSVLFNAFPILFTSDLFCALCLLSTKRERFDGLSLRFSPRD